VRGRLPLENELVPFVPGFPPGARWLVLAPHPDDEVLGPGAALAMAVRAGVEVNVVVLTDGAAQGEAGVRAAEARAAAAVLGIPEPELWGLADRSLRPDDPRLGRLLRRKIEDSAADTLLLPSPVELHPDHRALALAVQRALRRLTWWGVRQRGPQHVACYEVSAPLLPNLLVAADAGWEAKRAAAARYASQLAVWPYMEVAEGLGAFRALTLAGTRRAEAFHVVPAEKVVQWSARAWAASMGSPGCVRWRPSEGT
jgi:LmbE family N-acetylglucosaminyl deacetylase